MRRVISSISAALAALAVAGAASAQSLDSAELSAENSQQAIGEGLAIAQQAVEEKQPGAGQQVPTNVDTNGTQLAQTATSSDPGSLGEALSMVGGAGLGPQAGALGGAPTSVLGTSLGLPLGLGQLSGPSKF